MKELSVQDWFEELNQALEYRRLYGNENSWAELEALFYNVHPSNAHAGPNVIYSTGDALMSAMAVPEPYITVNPRRADFTVASRLQESVDNDLVYDMEAQEETEKVVLNAYIWGRGIIKIGYDSEYGYDPSMDIGLIRQTPLGMTLTQFSKTQQRIEFGVGTDPGMPWIKAVLPHDFLVPWGVFSIKDAPWCAHRVVRHIDDCKADVKYSTRELKPVMSDKDFVESYKRVPQVYRMGQDITRGFHYSELGTGDTEYVELWEIHDRRTGKIYVIATGHNKFLRNEHDALQLGGLPFVDLSLVPRARTFWTSSDAYYLRQAQHEGADIALQASRHRKLSNLRFLYGEDMLEEDELEKFLEGRQGACIKVNGGTDIRNAIAPMQGPPDLQTGPAMEVVRRDAREMAGFGRNQVGEYESTGRRTATEAQLVQQGAELRMDRRQGALAKLYTQIFRKINPIVQTYWTTPRWTQMIGQDGTQQFLQFLGPDMKGSYKYKVGFSVNPQESIQQRRQNAIQLFLALTQSPLVNPFAAARYLNSKYNDPEFTSLFQPGVLNGQLEMQMAMQGQAPDGGMAASGAGAGKVSSGQNGGASKASANGPGSVSPAGAGTR